MNGVDIESLSRLKTSHQSAVMVSLGMQTQYVAEWDLIHHEIMAVKNVQREYTGVNESTLEYTGVNESTLDAWCNHEQSQSTTDAHPTARQPHH